MVFRLFYQQSYLRKWVDNIAICNFVIILHLCRISMDKSILGLEWQNGWLFAL